MDIVRTVRQYITTFNQTYTDIQAYISDDRSISLRQRIALLSKNGLMGFGLVLGVLGLFLNLSIAFWVALSIPLCFMGLFIDGRISDILNDMAVVVIITLAISWLEGALMLPAHIAHSTPRPIGRLKQAFATGFDTPSAD